MNSSERKVELESRFCELERRESEVGAILQQKQVALKHELKNLPEKQIRWKHHDRNRVHVKNRADYVDLREYSETLKLWDRSKEELDEALFQVSRLKGDVNYYQEKLEDVQKDKQCIEDELGSYGQLIQFRKAS